jgi:hypothetical protein
LTTVLNGTSTYSTAVLEEQTVYKSSFSTAVEYVDVPFSTVVNRTDPGLCVVVGYSSGTSPAGTVQYESALLAILSGWMWSTSTNGTTFSGASTTKCLYCCIYGTTQ